MVAFFNLLVYELLISNYLRNRNKLNFWLKPWLNTYRNVNLKV